MPAINVLPRCPKMQSNALKNTPKMPVKMFTKMAYYKSKKQLS